jgi:hypothetical protein
MALSGWKQWSEEDAERELRALHASGEPMEVFARRRGYSTERLRRWAARLRRAAAPALLPVRVVTLPRGDTAVCEEPPVVEVVLRGGRLLRVARGFDERQVADLVRVLEMLPC